MRVYELAEDKPRLIRVLYPFSCPGIYALFWFRLIKANRRWRIPVLYYIFAFILRVFNTFTQWFFGICIASNSDIGPGLYIAHHGQIFVGVKSMGSNCTIGHSVTIGRTEKEHGYPTFGNNVYIAPGAVVIGKIEIGDNVKIGPNTVVRRNVPSNSIVMALPPKVIHMMSKEEWSQEKDSTDNVPAEMIKEGRSKDGIGKPGKESSNENRRENAPVSPAPPRNRKPPFTQDKRTGSNRYKPKHGNWKNKYRPKVEVKPKYSSNTNHKYGNAPQGAPRVQNPKPRDFADERLKTIRKKTVDTGTSPRNTSNRDKWAEDLDGESLDS